MRCEGDGEGERLLGGGKSHPVILELAPEGPPPPPADRRESVASTDFAVTSEYHHYHLACYPSIYIYVLNLWSYIMIWNSLDLRISKQPYNDWWTAFQGSSSRPQVIQRSWSSFIHSTVVNISWNLSANKSSYSPCFHISSLSFNINPMFLTAVLDLGL